MSDLFPLMDPLVQRVSFLRHFELNPELFSILCHHPQFNAQNIYILISLLLEFGIPFTNDQFLNYELLLGFTFYQIDQYCFQKYPVMRNNRSFIIDQRNILLNGLFSPTLRFQEFSDFNFDIVVHKFLQFQLVFNSSCLHCDSRSTFLSDFQFPPSIFYPSSSLLLSPPLIFYRPIPQSFQPPNQSHHSLSSSSLSQILLNYQKKKQKIFSQIYQSLSTLSLKDLKKKTHSVWNDLNVLSQLPIHLYCKQQIKPIHFSLPTTIESTSSSSSSSKSSASASSSSSLPPSSSDSSILSPLTLSPPALSLTPDHSSIPSSSHLSPSLSLSSSSSSSFSLGFEEGYADYRWSEERNEMIREQQNTLKSLTLKQDQLYEKQQERIGTGVGNRGGVGVGVGGGWCEEGEEKEGIYSLYRDVILIQHFQARQITPPPPSSTTIHIETDSYPYSTPTNSSLSPQSPDLSSVSGSGLGSGLGSGSGLESGFKRQRKNDSDSYSPSPSPTPEDPEVCSNCRLMREDGDSITNNNNDDDNNNNNNNNNHNIRRSSQRKRTSTSDDPHPIPRTRTRSLRENKYENKDEKEQGKGKKREEEENITALLSRFVNQPDLFLRTPLHYAMEAQRFWLVCELIQLGGSIHAKDTCGVSPASMMNDPKTGRKWKEMQDVFHLFGIFPIDETVYREEVIKEERRKSRGGEENS